MDRSIQQLHDLFEKLPKKADGTLKDKKKGENYSVRTGLTQRPLFKFLDVTKVSIFLLFFFLKH